MSDGDLTALFLLVGVAVGWTAGMILVVVKGDSIFRGMDWLLDRATVAWQHFRMSRRPSSIAAQGALPGTDRRCGLHTRHEGYLGYPLAGDEPEVCMPLFKALTGYEE